LPALDGLRGLAVLGVLGFHAGDWLIGGYLGVDLFFVLSGFLITSILLAEHRGNQKIDLKAFWIRRARRLLPAVVAMMPAIGLYAAFAAAPADRNRIRWDGLATLGYVANWRAIFAHRSYWDLFAAPSPLEHTWSLAIEEQFYLLWPLIVALVLTRSKNGNRRLLFLSLLLALASGIAMLWLFNPGATTRAYLGTDTRGAAILVGAALAAWLSPLGTKSWSRRKVRLLDGVAIVAALGIGWAWTRLDGRSNFLYRGGFWLTEIGSLVVITAATQGRASLVARALAVSPLRAVGTISYGVYLWHWPLFVFLSEERTHLRGLFLFAIRLGATFAIAIASYRWIERPIRRNRLRYAVIAMPLAFGSAIGALVFATRVRPDEVVAAAPSAPRPGPARRDLPSASELPKGTLRVLVVGDSVAEALGERMRFVQSRTFVAERGVGDCSLLEGIVPMRSLNGVPHEGGNCAAHWEADAAELHPDVTLIVLGGGFFAPANVGGDWHYACEKPWRDAYEPALVARLRALEKNGGQRIVLRVPHPVGIWKSRDVDARVDCYLQMVDDAAVQVSGVKTIDLDSKICPNRQCLMSHDGAPIRPDGLHFDGRGAEGIARWVESEIINGISSKN
jgi:peptidoglycan/LPS O-acetylase OafA/YrhL